MSGFQSTVFLQQGAGVPGEIYANTPRRSQAFTLFSDGVPNVFGYAFSITNQGLATVGNPSATTQNVTSLTSAVLVVSTSYTATATVADTAGYAVGDSVTIAGASPSQYNGTFTITAVTPTSFQYVITYGSALTTPATGSITYAGVANPFAGILVNPKGSASFGGTGGPLSPTLTLLDNQLGEIASMGTFFVSLPAACNIGDVVIYNLATGALATIARGAGLTSGYGYANAYVDYFNLSGAGIGVITLNSITPAVVQ
jgi:hypothetical protein